MPDDSEIAATIDQIRTRTSSQGVPGGEARPVPPECTDEALALRFTDLHKHRLQYVASWSRWLIREPAVWRFDETLHAFDMARAVCRQAAAECENPKIAATVASAKTVAAVERLARADRRHAATTDQWDADPWSLQIHRGALST